MPPKKKEKGGGKGASGAPQAANEPPQPAAGAPFCLSLVVEVSLQEATPHTGLAAPAPPDEGTSDAIDVECDQQSQLLVDPVFRYTFVNGDKIITPSIGHEGSSWARVDPAENDFATEIGHETLVSEAANKTRDEGSCLCPPRPVVWRYTRLHQLHGANADEVAVSLDSSPIMQVTLADKSSKYATVQPPGPGGGSATEQAHEPGEATEVILPGRNFIESWPLDLSAFLAGEVSVVLYVGDAACADVSASAMPNASQDENERCDAASTNECHQPESHHDKKSNAPPAPDGIRYVKLSVSVPHATNGTASKFEEDNVQPNTSDDSRNKRTAAWDTLLPVEVIQRLNPLSIKITSAASLPGVHIEAQSLQHHVKPTKFRLLETHCTPTYVVCRPFPDDPSSCKSLHPRLLWTPGSAQGASARFDHTSSFLLGPMDRHRVEEWVENSTLSVEVHDRNPSPSTQERRDNAIRLERMIAGGYPTGDDELISPDDDAPIEVTDEGRTTQKGGDMPSIRYLGPRDIFEVDDLALRESMAQAESAGKHHAHGVATFRLSALLDQSRQLVSAFHKTRCKIPDSETPATAQQSAETTNVAPVLYSRSEICQRKRREIPKGGVEDWHLSDEERFVRWPGAYLDAGSSLGIRLSLARPLRTLEEGSAEGTGPSSEDLRPFTRAVIIVEYEEGGPLMREVTSAIDAINGRALTNIQGSLRSYRFTPEERQAADDGALDVVCGFMVIDEDSRTIVLEGTAGPHGGLTELLQAVGRAGANGPQYRALENPEVRFSERLYSCFDADLKKVRLRDPLPVLCRNPEIYDRSKVSADCFDALHRLRMLRKMNRLREAAEHALFPEAAQLIQVESKYGESISVKDITGLKSTKKRRGKAAAEGRHEGNGTSTPEHATKGREREASGVGLSDDEERMRAHPRRKAPTDSSNALYEQWLRERKPRDFLAEQEDVLAKEHAEFLERDRRKRQDLEGEIVPTNWCYGPQKLTYVELKKAEMRERLAKDKGATYTYSMDYVSQTISLVDEFRLKEDQEAESRAAWKTKRGFVWPCPRTRQELITHPSKPSESRIDTLKEPWVEKELSGGGMLEATGGGAAGTPPNLAWRREFDTVPSNGKVIFGGLQPSKYARSLDTDMIGSRSRLPRGGQLLDKNPDFFRSVHLVGEGLAREKEETKRRVEEMWRSKVVVDDTNFRVGNFSVRDTPLQVDRAKDILQPPINKTAFKIVRNARLPSGKRATLRPPPVSAFSLNPFNEPEDFTASVRGSDPALWAATDPVTGEKADFHLRLHSDRMKVKSHKACARLKHPPLSPSEMRGSRWETGRGIRRAVRPHAA